MPKAKPAVNKSEAIREVFAQNPKAKLSEVVTALAERGIKANPSLIYAVKAALKRRKRKQVHAKAAAAIQRPNGSIIEVIRKVKALAAETGGFNKLKELVDALTE